MKQVLVKKNGVVSNQAQFETQQQAQAWIDYHESARSFGSKAVYGEILALISPEVRGSVQVQVTPPVLDAFGSELTPATFFVDQNGIITPAVFEKQTVLISPDEYSIEISDISSEIQASQLQSEKIAAGKKAREVCQQVLDLISGYNLDRELTIQQITQLQSALSAPEAALRSGRPALSKQLISAVQPDGNLVTQEMKAVALSLLSDY